MALLLLLLAAASTAAPQLSSAADLVGTYCANSFTDAQTQDSIDKVLADLVPLASSNYYATATAGTGNSTIFGLAQCRGDIPASACASCISAAATQAPSSCPGQADARVWYDLCFLRYSNEDFIGQLDDTGYKIILTNGNNASDPAAFGRVEERLMSSVAADAGESDSGGLVLATVRWFGSPAPTTIYGLGWCIKDISAADCGMCVEQAVAEMQNRCQYQLGCRVIYTSCMARYETYPIFFEPSCGVADSSSN